MGRSHSDFDELTRTVTSKSRSQLTKANYGPRRVACQVDSNQFRIWTLLCGIAVLDVPLTTSLATRYHRAVVEMAHFQSSNVIIHGGTFNSTQAQGDLHINNRDSGMHVLVRSEEHFY
jgi:hypothetical protein